MPSRRELTRFHRSASAGQQSVLHYPLERAVLHERSQQDYPLSDDQSDEPPRALSYASQYLKSCSLQTLLSYFVLAGCISDCSGGLFWPKNPTIESTGQSTRRYRVNQRNSSSAST